MMQYIVEVILQVRKGDSIIREEKASFLIKENEVIKIGSQA